MTEQEAIDWVRETSDEDATDEECEQAFRAIMGREPDARDRAEGLWSHLCTAVPASADDAE